MKTLWLSLCVLAILAAGCLGLTHWNRYQDAEEEWNRLKLEEETVRNTLSREPTEGFVNQAALALYDAREEQQEDTEDVAVFLSPQGIRFRSQSKAWNSQKLQELYQELLRNKHGQELYSLSQVIVHPEADEFAAASYMDQTQEYTLTLRHPSLPEEPVFVFPRVSGTIHLYDGDENDTVLSMAPSLSHEYGHHFTFYHMLSDSYLFTVYLESEYAQLRDLDATKLRLSPLSTEDYHRNHHWFYYEIAAEDYVVLMGSPNSRPVADYVDVEEVLSGAESVRTYGKNMDVQENLMIPMATQVPGLAEYFYSFVDDPAPRLEPRDFVPEITSNTVGYQLTTGYRTFTSWEITWEKVYGEDAVYTLVGFDPENYRGSLYPVRTVTAGETASATLGTVTREEGRSIQTMRDPFAEGVRTLVVTVILPDGTMYCSQPLTWDFGS